MTNKTNIFTCDNDADAEKVFEKIISSRVDGVVIYNPFISDGHIQRLGKYKLHSVLVAKDLSDPYMATVQIDFEAAIEQQIEAYLSRGIDDILYLDVDDPMSRRFLACIEDTFHSHNKQFQSKIAMDDSYTTTYDYFSQLFKSKPAHRVYIAPRDSLAIAIQNAATDNGLNVGVDFDVIGIIGTKYSVMARPQLTSINLDLYEVGSIAMRMMTKKLNHTLTNNQFRFSCEFTNRASSHSK
jgi:LacI family transcriptional regulator